MLDLKVVPCDSGDYMNGNVNNLDDLLVSCALSIMRIFLFYHAEIFVSERRRLLLSFLFSLHMR